MSRREEIAERMAQAIMKRLATKKIVDIRDEAGARAAVRHVIVDDLAAE